NLLFIIFLPIGSAASVPIDDTILNTFPRNPVVLDIIPSSSLNSSFPVNFILYSICALEYPWDSISSSLTLDNSAIFLSILSSILSLGSLKGLVTKPLNLFLLILVVSLILSDTSLPILTNSDSDILCLSSSKELLDELSAKLLFFCDPFKLENVLIKISLKS